ncbi:aminoglycoside phosphotransferase family protein [Cytobacillus sp. FSL K6-0265]|uniref:aminoglycoside phosphotransferase family protein n=1 Tax=Cytobacillus sp. FSL K6-0265 TaxID=2921448 RepID=UPI0030F94EB6
MKELIKKHLPHLQEIQIESNHSGWDHHIYIVNQTYVIRIPKTKQVLAKMNKEIKLLHQLSYLSSIIEIPNYHPFYNKDGQVIGVFYPFIKGQALSHSLIIPPLYEAKRLGIFLTELHRLDIYEAKKGGIEERHNKDYWAQLQQTLKTKIFPFLNEGEKEEINKLFLAVSKFKEAKVVIHGDLTSANILYHPIKKEISGIIDFTDTQIGDPAFDFAGLYWDFGDQFTKEALAAYETQFNKEEMYRRVTSFYGLQPIFHEWLKIVNEQDEKIVRQSINKGMTKIQTIRKIS